METPGRKLIVGYLRTSTDDQRLGIDAQRERLQSIAIHKNCRIIHEYTEHESGGNNDRPELDKAVRHARRLRAHLVVAKLDRLARDQQFLMKLVDGDVPLIFGDIPDVEIATPEGRMMLQMFGSYAEFERRRIGTRTREALRVLRKQGVPLGASRPECRNLTPEARRRGAAESARKSRDKAVEDQKDVAERAAELLAEGLSLRKIAKRLGAEGWPTRKAKLDENTDEILNAWKPAQVKRILNRAGIATGRPSDRAPDEAR